MVASTTRLTSKLPFGVVLVYFCILVVLLSCFFVFFAFFAEFCVPCAYSMRDKDVAVADWMRSNRLQLNSDKTEFMWCATVRRRHCLATVGPLIGSSTVRPSSAVRDLGVYIDSGLTMQRHVRQTVSRCFAVLRQLRTVRRQVPT